MNTKNKRIAQIAVWSIVLISILSTFVFAQGNFLEEIGNIWQGVDFGATYLMIAPFVDFIIFLFFFLGVARVTLEQKFKGGGAVWIVRSMGVAMAFGTAVFEYNSGFNLGQLGLLWMIVFFGVVIITIFNLIKNAGGGIPAAGAWAFLILYFVLQSLAPEVWDGLPPMVRGLLSIAVPFAVIAALFGLFKMLGGMVGAGNGMFGGGGGGGPGGRGGGGGGPGGKKGFWDYMSDRKDRKREEKETKEKAELDRQKADALSKAAKLNSEIGNIQKNLEEMNKRLEEIEKTERLEYEYHKKLIADIARYSSAGVNAGRTVEDIIDHMEKNPKAYESSENMQQIKQDLSTFGSYIDGILKLLHTLTESLKHLNASDKYIEKLEDFGIHHYQLLEKKSKIELKDILICIEDLLKSEKTEIELEKQTRNEKRTHLETSELIDIENKLKNEKGELSIDNLEEGQLKNLFKEIQVILKGSKEGFNLIYDGISAIKQIYSLDYKDMVIIDEDIKLLSNFRTGVLNSVIRNIYGNTIALIRRAGLLNKLGQLMIIGEQDLRKVYENSNILSAHLIEKLKVLVHFQKLTNEQDNYIKIMEQLKSKIDEIMKHISSEEKKKTGESKSPIIPPEGSSDESKLPVLGEPENNGAIVPKENISEAEYENIPPEQLTAITKVKGILHTPNENITIEDMQDLEEAAGETGIIRKMKEWSEIIKRLHNRGYNGKQIINILIYLWESKFELTKDFKTAIIRVLEVGHQSVKNFMKQLNSQWGIGQKLLPPAENKLENKILKREITIHQQNKTWPNTGRKNFDLRQEAWKHRAPNRYTGGRGGLKVGGRQNLRKGGSRRRGGR